MDPAQDPDSAPWEGDAEVERIRGVYASYDVSPSHAERWSPTSPGNVFLEEEKRRTLHRMLSEENLFPLSQARILDVGCGNGAHLALLCEWGATPSLCHGVDLLPDRIAAGRELFPELDLDCGDGRSLRFADASFRMVMTHVVFSSITDVDVAAKVASEMRRVVEPDGAIVWRDFRLQNPLNRNMRRYGRRELRRLFPGCSLRITSLCPLPPLTRRVGRYSTAALPALSKMRLLNSQVVAVIRPEL